MEPMVQQIEAEQAPLPEDAEYYVDGGFTNKDDIQSVGRRGVTVFAPVKEAEKQERRGKDPYVAKPRRQARKLRLGACGWGLPRRRRNTSSGAKRNGQTPYAATGDFSSSCSVVWRR